MAASGFAGLGYQIVWTRQCALWLGHESAAVLAVIAAFFGGLAAGAWWAGPRIECSRHPVRWYVACEAAIALWSLALVFLMRPFGAGMLQLTGVNPTPLGQWTLAFSGTFLLLLPATASMGATLPAMERVMAGLRAEGRSIAAYYSANTFGAVLGVLATAFRLIPQFGLIRTAAICIVLNLLCAAVALAAFPRHPRPPPNPAHPVSRARRGLLAQLACTGLLGIGYEVLVVRVLSQVSENTVYTYAWLLAVYLVGTALGAAAYQRWLARTEPPDRLDDRLLFALAVACLIGTASLWAAEDVKALLLERFGPGVAVALGTEAALALLAFGLPTFVMGALFSHLGARANAHGAGFGYSLGANTLGAAAAPILFGAVLAPWLGSKWTLLSIVIGYLALTTGAAWFTAWAWVPLVLAVALGIFGPPLRFVDIPEGGHVVSYREGAMASVSVVEDAYGVARLRINNRQQEGSSATRLVDGRQALLPVLLHPAPRNALFLGLGTGITASTAAGDPTLEVEAVELLPEVIEASEHFTRALRDGAPNPRLHLIAADARRYVRASRQSYDVIVSDNFHPARSGSGALYTVEHFRAVRERLASGGVFCQWLPLHQLDLETLRSIVRSFLAAYPGGWAMLASNSLETPVLGLVGRGDEGRFDLAGARLRLSGDILPESPADFGIEDEYALLGSFVSGPAALARLAGSAPANTDDRPVVAYRAPRATYAPESPPRDRLLALLNELWIEPEELVDATLEADGAHRLAAYWSARNRYIDAGRNVRPASGVEKMLAQVREPLLAVLRISPDFRPAYDPLVRMGAALGRIDPAAAHALLTELAAIQPARSEAGAALRQLAAEPREIGRP